MLRFVLLFRNGTGCNAKRQAKRNHSRREFPPGVRQPQAQSSGALAAQRTVLRADAGGPELASHGLYPLLHCHSGDCPAEFRRWLEARAVHLVTYHWRGISRLAAALMEHQDLSGQEAERLLRGRG